MTTTPNKGYSLPTVGSDFGVWGTELNTIFTTQDLNIGGYIAVNVAGNTDVTANAAQAPNLVQNLTGALTGNIHYLLPAAGGIYIIKNSTSGAFTITVITVAGGSTGVVVPQGKTATLWSDGTNIYEATTSINTLTVSTSLTVGTFTAANSTVSGNSAVSGFFQVNGSTSITVSGWQYSSTGPSPISGATSVGIYANGQNIVGTNFFAVSDVRLKHDIEPISDDDALAWVMASRPVTYLKKSRFDDVDAGQAEAGFIAQEQVRAGYGRYVGTVPCEGMPEQIDADGFRSMPDAMLTLSSGYQVAYLTAAVKALLERVRALESGYVK